MDKGRSHLEISQQGEKSQSCNIGESTRRRDVFHFSFFLSLFLTFLGYSKPVWESETIWAPASGDERCRGSLSRRRGVNHDVRRNECSPLSLSRGSCSCARRLFIHTYNSSDSGVSTSPFPLCTVSLLLLLLLVLGLFAVNAPQNSFSADIIYVKNVTRERREHEVDNETKKTERNNNKKKSSKKKQQ